MQTEMPRALHAEIEWVIALALQKGSGGDTLTLKRAIRARSGMIARRLEVFLDNARPWRDLTDEESSRLGSLLIAVECWHTSKNWRLWLPEDDGKTSNKTDFIQIRISPGYKRRIQLFCQRTGSNISTLITDALEEHLAENHLWINNPATNDED